MSILDTLGPKKSGPNLISKWVLFSVRVFMTIDLVHTMSLPD